MNRFLNYSLALLVGLSFLSACTKEEKATIQDNLIVGNWMVTSEKTTTYLNTIPLGEKTKEYTDKDFYLLNFKSDNTLYKTFANTRDTSFGTYTLSGTTLKTDLKISGTSYKESYSFNVSNTSLLLSYSKDVDSLGKMYNYGNEISFSRK